jgi:alkylhydroperoxidase family enzyme
VARETVTTGLAFRLVFNVLHEHFSEAQTVELTAAIALENFRARCNHASGISY